MDSNSKSVTNINISSRPEKHQYADIKTPQNVVNFQQVMAQTTVLDL